MVISLERQDRLMHRLENLLVSYTLFDLLRGDITSEERNWMFDWVAKQLNLPFLGRRKETKTMAHTGAIVVRAEGKVIPDEFIDIVAGTNEQYIGYAFPEDGEITIGQLDGGKTESLTTIKNTMVGEDSKNVGFALIFGKGADTDESKQPFNTLQNEAGNCICATFVEGDLQGFGAPESSHSIEFAAHQEYLLPKIISIFGSFDEDIPKTVGNLNMGFVKREITNACFPTPESRGEILLIFANGQTVHIVKGDKHRRYDWGDTSQSFGYEGKTAEDIKVETKKNVLGKSNMKVDPKTLPDTAIALAMDLGKNNLDYMITPPVNRLSSFKDAQAWYNTYGHPDHRPSDADIENSVKTKRPLVTKVRPVITNKAFNEFLEKKKITLAPDQAAKAPAVIKKPVVPISIIPDSEREKLTKDFLPAIVKAIKNYDDGSHLIVPPEDIMKFMRDKPVATMQLGIDKGLDEFENYSTDAFRMMQKHAPEAIVALLDEYRLDRIKNKMALNQATSIKKAM